MIAEINLRKKKHKVKRTKLRRWHDELP